MTRRILVLVAAAVAAIALVAGSVRALKMFRTPSPAAQRANRIGDTREAAYRANNIGVALLEQFNYTDAATAFRQARQLDPSLAIPRVNLAIALLYQPDLDGAAREAAAAAQMRPGDPRPQYLLGLIARERGQADAATAAFQRVLQADPHDVGSHVNLGQVLLQQQRFQDAAVQFRAALEDEPYNVTAAYNLGLALTRAGQRDEGQKAMELSQQLRNGGYGTIYSPGYLQQGQYAEAVASTGAEPDLVDRNTPDVTFDRVPLDGASGVEQGARAASPFGQRFGADDPGGVEQAIVKSLGGGLTLLDYDRDGDLDVVIASSNGLRLLRNDAGRFVDVTHETGLDALSIENALGAVAGDYDNDGVPDLLIVRYGGNVLLHNDGGRFSDATKRSHLPAYRFLSTSAAFVDFDHDGDLDIVVAGLADLGGAKRARSADGTRRTQPARFPDEFPGAPLQFVRNNGDGTFTDITADTKVAGLGHATAVVATDYDNHRDVDLLVAQYDAPPLLLKNLRDGTFRDVAAETGLQVSGAVSAVAVADFNKDDYPDLFFGRSTEPGVFARSDRHGRFTLTSAPASTTGALSAQFIDYDNDGLLDLLAWTSSGPRLYRNLGDRWSDVSARAFPGVSGDVASARSFVAADIDGDGDTDLISAGTAASVWRNNGGNRNRTLRVQLAGRASNHFGIGSKIEMRAGSLRQRIETSASTPAAAPADVLFGLGTRPGADAVRVVWPSGILQSEIGPRGAAGVRASLASRLTLEELDRKPSSCPFLFTWNGTRFEFVTDFMGGGEMGYWESPGVRNRPDPEEYVRIRGDQLVPKNGRYELRVTNELEEAVFLDRLQLLAVTHADDVEVFPNEGMTDPPKPFRIFAARQAHPPDRVLDEHGHDVTDRIARMDRRYPDDFELDAVRGYAKEHTLTIDIAGSNLPRANGRDRQERPDLLLLTGWTDYAFSSDNVAASHSGRALHPPVLEARAAEGPWRVVADDVGIPVGRPQTIVVDLRGRLRGDDTAIRLRTNMRIYWDRIALASAAATDAARIQRLDPAAAALRVRGFSEEIAAVAPDPVTYDYDRVTTVSPWKTMLGAYTRDGDVTPLVGRSDDRFVVAAPGDEIAVSFDATGLDPLPARTERTFLLRADGFSKEMDANSASPEFVEPLPFHGMSTYPYRAWEHYPDDAEHQRYREEYNTRRVAVPFPSLDILIQGAAEPWSRREPSIERQGRQP